MEPNVVVNVDMFENESEIFIEKRNKEKAKKLVIIPNFHLRNKNNMGRNCMNKELNGCPKEEILQLGYLFCIIDESKVDV